MRKPFFLLAVLFSVLLALPVQSRTTKQANKYQCTIDLTQVKDDEVPVTIVVPPVAQNQVEFHMPKIVPGTYSISDFGRFIKAFKAYNAQGEALTVEQLTDNRWLISDATQLHNITYWVEDTYDTELGNKIFEPAGTNIEAERNIFVINTHGFIGYLDGLKQVPFEVTIKKPNSLFGATSLPLQSTDDSTDVYVTENYMNLADAPMMYSQPDTSVLTVGGAEILVSVYSPGNKLTAAFVMENLKEVLLAQKEYLGGKLPIDRYAFMIYLFDRYPATGAFGALEHSYSSLYSLPDIDPGTLAKHVRDIAAHEFFHIVTPLNIHSEQIHYFNYITPEMSQHLWLYEGVTEYSAHHVQVQHGLTNTEVFLNEMMSKIKETENYNDTVPFTYMSSNCLGKYEPQYQNVYYKGALIGMCLDIELLTLSQGKYNLQSLMRDLAQSYGKTTPFKDEELFDKIEALTYPEIGQFLRTYVGGPTPLPLEATFKKAGIYYRRREETQIISLGNIRIESGTEATYPVTITDVSQLNAFGQEMGFQEGDQIVRLNKTKVNSGNFAEVIDEWKAQTKAGDRVTMTVLRPVEGQKAKKKKLKASAIEVTIMAEWVMKEDDQATPAQQAVKQAWLSASQ